jgi:hypothetical protein
MRWPELADTMYDAVAHYKHRAEGETNSTFAYAVPSLREESFRQNREALWALDVSWTRTRERRHTINFLRYFAGPIQMMMRRYRFVEDNLTIGRPEDEQVVDQTRQSVKLWYRNDRTPETGAVDARYETILAQKDRLLFPGLAEMLNRPLVDRCPQCRRRASYGAEAMREFGGVKLCDSCQTDWNTHLLSFSARVREVLPLSPAKTWLPPQLASVTARLRHG